MTRRYDDLADLPPLNERTNTHWVRLIKKYWVKTRGYYLMVHNTDNKQLARTRTATTAAKLARAGFKGVDSAWPVYAKSLSDFTLYDETPGRRDPASRGAGPASTKREKTTGRRWKTFGGALDRIGPDARHKPLFHFEGCVERDRGYTKREFDAETKENWGRAHREYERELAGDDLSYPQLPYRHSQGQSATQYRRERRLAIPRGQNEDRLATRSPRFRAHLRAAKARLKGAGWYLVVTEKMARTPLQTIGPFDSEREAYESRERVMDSLRGRKNVIVTLPIRRSARDPAFPRSAGQARGTSLASTARRVGDSAKSFLRRQYEEGRKILAYEETPPTTRSPQHAESRWQEPRAGKRWYVYYFEDDGWRTLPKQYWQFETRHEAQQHIQDELDKYGGPRKQYAIKPQTHAQQRAYWENPAPRLRKNVKKRTPLSRTPASRRTKRIPRGRNRR